jgi:plasmid stability protein
MPTFTVRDVSDSAAQAIRERAAAAGKSTEAYIREWIEQQALAPVVKPRYTVRAYDDGDGAARCHLRREVDGLIGRGAADCSEAQFKAYKAAADLVARNAPGDRERAIGLLAAVFDTVVEV